MFHLFVLLAVGRSSAFLAVTPASSRTNGYAGKLIQRWGPETTTATYSLNKFLSDVESKDSYTVFVGGKGGTGKTTTSSAIAIQIAETVDKDVLVVSSDPAHSLGDALDMELSGTPTMVPMMPRGNLYAQEIDGTKALKEFRKTLEAFDVSKLAEALQVDSALLESLGLGEFSNLLNNPPPGLDELIALSAVFETEYDIVVVDTAPTGHTLRLLALPQFLDTLLGKLIRLRSKLFSVSNKLQSMFGNEEAGQRQQTIDKALTSLENFKARMSKLQSSLQDQARSSFVIVTIPTTLGMAESTRLLDDLRSQSIAVTDMIVNQCIETHDSSYFDRRKSQQDLYIQKLSNRVEQVNASPEYQSFSKSSLNLVEIPYFDVELVGVPALGYVGSSAFASSEFDDLRNADGTKVVICGGKGGVGKTTSSASLAVNLAAAGKRVAIISTDPAHSLGDAVDCKLSGTPTTLPLIGVPGDTGTGSLTAMEVDPSKAISQFKNLISNLVGGETGETSDGMASTLIELQEVFDTLPAGTDEVVALANIIELIKSEDYDRIILDTAPTGHTLRMLSTPSFLADLLEKILKISDKINNSVAGLFLKKYKDQIEANKAKLLKFQFRMYDLEDLFADTQSTEFLIVTVPTELAVRESSRLLNDLVFNDSPIAVKHIMVNQVLRETDPETFLSHLQRAQDAAIAKTPSGVEITKVPYLDTEPRGVYGLKAIAAALTQED